jgi:hypothetical protein
LKKIDFPKIADSISRRKKEALIFVLWGMILGLIVIKVYWVGYQEIKWLQYYKVPYGWYETPSPNLLDLFLVLIASIIVGALISNTKVLFYGYIVGIVIAFFISFAYVMFYMWAVLQLKYFFSWAYFSWEWAVLFAVWNVSKIMFPQVILLSLLGVIAGAFLYERIGY